MTIGWCQKISFAHLCIQVDHFDLKIIHYQSFVDFRFFFSFFSILVFFHEHLRFTGQQGKGEVTSLIPVYHVHLLHRHLEISRAIPTESSTLLIDSSRTRNGNRDFRVQVANPYISRPHLKHLLKLDYIFSHPLPPCYRRT